MACNTATTTTTRDLNAIWHPFVQRVGSINPIPITRAKGTYYYDEKGNHYLDAISSWWVNLHGHSHPHICAAINKQLESYDQIIFTHFTHTQAIELVERLLEQLPLHSKGFFTDDGSTAVEAALKMAIHYWKNQGVQKKK